MKGRRLALAAGLGGVLALGLLWVSTGTVIRRQEAAMDAPAASVAPEPSPPRPRWGRIVDVDAPDPAWPRLFMELAIFPADHPVTMSWWAPPYFDSAFVGGPREGWGSWVFVHPRRLDPPEWVEQRMTALGVTPGLLVEPLLWVDPWLAATAASADHQWAKRKRLARWMAEREGLSVEEQKQLRKELDQDRPENDHRALFESLAPGHDATALVTLDQLDSAGWSNGLAHRKDLFAFVRDAEDDHHVAAVATSLIAPIRGRPLDAEERRIAEELMGHDEPAIRGAMALVVALDDAGEEDLRPDSPGLDVLEEAAEACRRSMGRVSVYGSDRDRVATLGGEGDFVCSKLVSNWDDLRTLLGDQLPILTWQDAVRHAAEACGRSAPSGLPDVVTGTFDGEAWRWEGEEPMSGCLTEAALHPAPSEPLLLDLSVHERR